MNRKNNLFQKLLARKADVHATNEHGMTALHYACFWGYEQIAEDLIQSGAMLGACNKKGQTVLDVCQPQCRNIIMGGYFFKFENYELSQTERSCLLGG